LALPDEEVEKLDPATRFLVRACSQFSKLCAAKAKTAPHTTQEQEYSQGLAAQSRRDCVARTLDPRQTRQPAH